MLQCSGQMELLAKRLKRIKLLVLPEGRRCLGTSRGLELASVVCCSYLFCSQVPALLEAGLKLCSCGV